MTSTTNQKNIDLVDIDVEEVKAKMEDEEITKGEEKQRIFGKYSK